MFAEQDLPGGVHRHHVQWPAVDEHGIPGPWIVAPTVADQVP